MARTRKVPIATLQSPVATLEPLVLQRPKAQLQGSRVRGVKLQKIRARHLAKYPLCVACQANGTVRAAQEIDHIVALVNGGTDTDDNRQGLCKPCHAKKTALDLKQFWGF